MLVPLQLPQLAGGLCTRRAKINRRLVVQWSHYMDFLIFVMLRNNPNLTNIDNRMTTWIKKSLVVLGTLSLSCLSAQAAVPQRGMMLNYNRPAAVWMTEALPIGNGELGAMFMGGGTP